VLIFSDMMFEDIEWMRLNFLFSIVDMTQMLMCKGTWTQNKTESFSLNL